VVAASFADRRRFITGYLNLPSHRRAEPNLFSAIDSVQSTRNHHIRRSLPPRERFLQRRLNTPAATVAASARSASRKADLAANVPLREGFDAVLDPIRDLDAML
jgi:hypothetical protein